MKSSVGLGLAVVDRVAEVGDDVADAVSAALGVVGELEHVADPLGERGGHVFGDTEDVADHAYRDLLGVLGGGVAVAAVEHIVDETSAQLAGEHLVLGDPGGAHGGQDQSAGPGVQRRIGADRRHTGGEDR